ncbi:MAG: calcium/sodium antiporter [Gammaproteobacteria bacterium]|nr:calcium/sodium antiporter [Gammaproteobacteria bacterium]
MTIWIQSVVRVKELMMPEFLDTLKLFGGFVYLLMGGELLVRGALAFSKRTRIPAVVVGMTVVAMGTSAPELMISILAALSGHPDVAVGNVIGSNIANVLLVLGVPLLLYPIATNQPGLRWQTSLMIAVSIFFIVLCYFQPITIFGGISLVSVLVVFLIASARGVAILPNVEDAEEELKGIGLPSHPSTILLLIVLGCIALPLGADLVVRGGVGLAASWGIKESVIGLSLVALGTSLPELSTTLVAAFHKNSDVAIGNVIGSNLFNILAILGITAILTDIPVSADFMEFDIWVMLAASLTLWIAALLKASLGRLMGAFYLGSYLLYIWILF